MASIRSVLIRTCMANIQKEMSQLEHWLNNFGDDSRPETTNYTSSPGMSELFTAIEKLSGQLILQEHTLNNINDRLEILEETREVHIDNKYDNLPWVDNCCVPLNDELLSEEPVYTINKKSETDDASVKTPSIIPNVADDVSDIPDIDSDNNSVTDIEIADTPQDIIPEKQEITVKNTDKLLEKAKGVTESDDVKVKQDERVIEDNDTAEKENIEGEEYEDEDEKEEQEQDQEEEEQKDEKQEEQEDKEDEEQEEEEDGIELEELEYKGVTYYRDSEGFIYSVDDDEQPSENPIGYWKEKTQTIAFYKTK